MAQIIHLDGLLNPMQKKSAAKSKVSISNMQLKGLMIASAGIILRNDGKEKAKEVHDILSIILSSD